MPIHRSRRPADATLAHSLGHGLSLATVLDEVDYLTRALAATHNNKTQAADLLGLASYQTLSNRLARLGL